MINGVACSILTPALITIPLEVLEDSELPVCKVIDPDCRDVDFPVETIMEPLWNSPYGVDIATFPDFTDDSPDITLIAPDFVESAPASPTFPVDTMTLDPNMSPPRASINTEPERPSAASSALAPVIKRILPVGTGCSMFALVSNVSLPDCSASMVAMFTFPLLIALPDLTLILPPF